MTFQNSLLISNKDMPDRMPEDLPDRMPEDMPEHMPEDMPDGMPDKMPEDMSDRMPEDLPVMVGITRKLTCKLDKTMLVLLHQIAAAATLYFSTRPLQSKPIRSHWQSTVSGCLQCIIDRPGLQPLQRRSSFGFQLVSQFSQVGRRAFA